VIVVDAWTIDRLDDVNAALLRGIPRAWLAGERLHRLLSALRSLAVASVDEAGRPTLRLAGEGRGADDPSTSLGRILRGIDALAQDAERQAAVVIDEFQRLGEVQEGAEGALRSAVQETGALGYVFTGSSVGLVQDLLGPKGPFHAMERLEIGAIEPDHLVSWLEHRLDANGVRPESGLGDALYDRGGPVTEYVIRLAKVTYRRARESGRASAEAVAEAFREVVADYEGSFELIWDGLAAGKRQVLRAVAAGEQKLTSRAVMEEYGISSSAAASYGIRELQHDGLLAPGKPFRVSDPFFAAWVREV